MESTTGALLLDESSMPAPTDSKFLAVIRETDFQPLRDSGNDEVSRDTEVPPVKKRRIFELVLCEYCGRDFTEKKSMYRHQRTSRCGKAHAIGFESHVCSACGKSFSRADTLQRHEREHHQKLGRRTTGDDLSQGLWQSKIDTVSGADTNDGYDTSAIQYVEAGSSSQAYPYLASPELSPRRELCKDVMAVEEQRTDCSGAVVIAAQDIAIGQPNLHTTADLGTSNQAVGDGISVKSTASTRPFGKLTTFPTRVKAFLERRGASPGFTRPKKNGPLCPVCRKPFETDATRLIAHIGSHVKDWESRHTCTACDIGFQCRSNLDFHLLSASRGSCGIIGFKHTCTGHHPPERAQNSSKLTNHEHLALYSFIRDWEQVQMDALLVSIDEVKITALEAFESRWSFSIARSERGSNYSCSVTAQSFCSEPKPPSCEKSSRVPAIERKLANVPGSERSGLIREHAIENAALLEIRHLNDALFQAIVQNDTNGVRSLLGSGALPYHRKAYAQPLKISFLMHRPSVGDSVVRTVERRYHSPLSLATYLGNLQMVEFLTTAEAAEWLLRGRELDLLSFYRPAMVISGTGVAASILYGCARCSGARNTGLGSLALFPAVTRMFQVEEREANAMMAVANSLAICDYAADECFMQVLIHENKSLALQAVLELGIDPDETLRNGFPPLQYALDQNSYECVLVLIVYQARCSPIMVPSLTACTSTLVSGLLADSTGRHTWYAKHILKQFWDATKNAHDPIPDKCLLQKAIRGNQADLIRFAEPPHVCCQRSWLHFKNLPKCPR